MSTNILTIVEGISCHENYLAAFVGDTRVQLVASPRKEGRKGLKALKATVIQHLSNMYPQHKVQVVPCNPYYQEFESVSDFPVSLTAYYK